jgi:hypothetical protein
VAQHIPQQVAVEVQDLQILKHQEVRVVVRLEEDQELQERKVQEMQEVFLHLKEIQEELE